MASALHALASVCTSPQAGTDEVVRACELIRDALGAEDAYVMRAGDPAFTRVGCPCDPSAYEIKQKGYWIVWRQAATNPQFTAGLFDAAGGIVSGGTPLRPNRRASHLGAILPSDEGNSDLLVVRGPWPSGLPGEQVEFVETARPLLASLVSNVLDAERRNRQREQFESLANVSKAFNQAQETDDVLLSLATALAKASGFDWVTITRFNDKCDGIAERAMNLARYSSTKIAERYRERSSSTDEQDLRFGMRMARHDAVALIPDAFDPDLAERMDLREIREIIPRLSKLWERAHILSVAMLPIVFQGTPLGLVAFSSSTKRAFDAQEVSFLQALAAQAATAIKGVQLYRERCDAEAALRRGQDLLTATIESTADGILVVDGSGHVEYANRRFAEMWHIPEALLAARDDDALLGYVLDQLLEPEQFLAKVRELYQSTAEDVDTIVRKDGRVFERYSRPLVQQDGAAGRVWSFRDVSERQRFEAQLIELANSDALTGLFNRRRFEEELEARLASGRRYGISGALLFLDVDQFKDINDSRGHRAGDELLVSLGRLLRARLRETDVVGRLGGDEFAILLPHTEGAQALLLAEDVGRAVSDEEFMVDGSPVRITASVGVALYPEHGESAAELLSRADVAMYQVKAHGRNGVRLFSPESDSRAQSASRVDWQRRLHEALKHDGFVLHAQPILDLRRDEVSQYELLLRAVNIDGHLVLPGEFIAVAERSGLIRDIDRWVVQRAIRMIAAERDQGRSVRMEVNLSGQALRDPELLRIIEAELRATDIDPACLILEVTETAAITNLDDAARLVRALKELGCGFALDDFGVGFSSFAHLKHLPVDYLKIDGSFIRDLPRTPTDQHLVRAIVGVARALGKRTIAEFVNDEATVALLKEYGVDFAQGYYIGRPGPYTGEAPARRVA